MANTQMMKKIGSQMSVQQIKPIWFLLAGIVSMTAAHMTFNIDVAAWISMVPFLLYLRMTKGWKSRIWFVLALIVAWSFVVLKIITSPIPVFFTFLYSIPISLFHLPGYLIWDKFKDQRFSIFIFPAVMVVLEWIQYTFTPLASWGVAAYTQVHSIALIQFLSIFGMAGLSFLIYWVNVSIVEVISKKGRNVVTLGLPLVVLACVILFGMLRYDMAKSKGVDTITMAAVGTDSEIGGLPLPDREENIRDIKEIFKRTRSAAAFGAEIIVWTEGAFFLEPDYEASWIDSIKQLAMESQVTLVAAYVLPVSESPFKYENKYLLIDPQGQISHTYLKHQPVPGEPAIKGQGALQTFDVAGTHLGGAICYDYDFPYLAKGYGNLGADIVAVPSSDWRGIDPLHTQMAAFRAVEQGHSVLRSTRFGLSAGITPYGEMTSQMSSFDDNNQIMISNLPKRGVATLYATIGDLFVYLCIAFIPLFWVMKKRE